MIAVASLAKWHGYDRLIEGWANMVTMGSIKYICILGEEQTPGVCNYTILKEVLLAGTSKILWV